MASHGRGVAWTANQLGQKAGCIYAGGQCVGAFGKYPREGAEAEITDLNYDDAVRLAQKMAEESFFDFRSVLI